MCIGIGSTSGAWKTPKGHGPWRKNDSPFSSRHQLSKGGEHFGLLASSIFAIPSISLKPEWFTQWETRCHFHLGSLVPWQCIHNNSHPHSYAPPLPCVWPSLSLVLLHLSSFLSHFFHSTHIKLLCLLCLELAKPPSILGARSPVLT